MSRLATATSAPEFVDLRRQKGAGDPFSSFQFVDAEFDRTTSIRRLFSIARAQEAETMILETVPPEGAVQVEVQELQAMFPGYQMEGLKRLSFWKQEISCEDEMSMLEEEQCIGYALLKKDLVPDPDPEKQVERWHVFEAVFPHRRKIYQYWPAARRRFAFRCGGRQMEIEGCLYAQQNSLNKACAQVALRSLCATYLGNYDLTYRQINELASGGDPNFKPADGLNAQQIPLVLKGLGIGHRTLDYESDPGLRDEFPYPRVVYSGIESGCGALLAFGLSGPEAEPETGHTLSCFGHTFNEDSWGPHADVHYFKVGESIRYHSSLAWTSSFVVHDDNFGPNLCVHQSFIKDRLAWLVEVLLPLGYVVPGYQAELQAADYFYSILPELYDDNWNSTNPWVTRLLDYVLQKKLILRTVPVSAEEYLANLAAAEDWEFHTESREALQLLQGWLSGELNVSHLWMVEVSVPEVFPTNKRKLGEILIDASQPLVPEKSGASFVMARFPEVYVFFGDPEKKGEPEFWSTRSAFKSHLPLLSR